MLSAPWAQEVQATETVVHGGDEGPASVSGIAVAEQRAAQNRRGRRLTNLKLRAVRGER